MNKETLKAIETLQMLIAVSFGVVIGLLGSLVVHFMF
jgi:hypothetical protein